LVLRCGIDINGDGDTDIDKDTDIDTSLGATDTDTGDSDDGGDDGSEATFHKRIFLAEFHYELEKRKIGQINKKENFIVIVDIINHMSLTVDLVKLVEEFKTCSYNETSKRRQEQR
jgi:hypothetical protein